MNKINFQNLPSTSTPVNATNLNKIQENVEKEVPVADTRRANLSWNNYVTSGEKYRITTINGLESGTSLGEGAPTGAYDYGTLITLNPRQSTTSGYDQTQIYIEDGLTNSSRKGLYFRKRTGDWISLIRDIDLQVVDKTNNVTTSSGYTKSGIVYTFGKVCTVNINMIADSDTQSLVHDTVVASGFPKPPSNIQVMSIPITDNLEGVLKLCRFVLNTAGQLKVYYPVGGYFSTSTKPRYFNFSYVTQ